ncbi:hypothetical protein [Bacillus pseudomycoides]|uniref:hypothetical protein n=1 Tax=Bacillus pseudomycoides TaxID=64104 RepID=UPI000BF0AB1A|nr:hypothetical protein [Bacillus pseudomycoides]PEK69602.1 hypothetical protein CN590_09905 [Bacillus pseudomycoides]
MNYDKKMHHPSINSPNIRKGRELIMELNDHWLENKIIQECKDSDIYTIFSLYMDMIKICKQESIEKTA